MEKLKQAETIDHFEENVRTDPINRLARQGLFYGPATSSSDVIPWLLNTEIVTMYPTAEAGLPHTRPPNLICLPQWFPETKKQETLLHEYIHLDQRNRQHLWDTKFKKEGWTPIVESELPPRLVRISRMNPDTIDSRFWAWEGRHVPLPLFEREDKPNLRQVTIQWYDLEKGNRQPQAPRRFVERYGSFPSQPEHPRELSAVELSKSLQTTADIDSYLGI